MNYWTEADKASLAKMWGEDMSAAEIAKALGKISRNSILGMANRMGLPKHQGVANKKRLETPRMPVSTFVPRPKTPPKPPTYSESMATVVTSSGTSLLDIKDNQCHAIIGRDSGFLTRYCGAPVKEGSWCCPNHYARFYNAPRWGARV